MVGPGRQLALKLGPEAAPETPAESEPAPAADAPALSPASAENSAGLPLA
jgi:hypothetical protein